MQILKGIFIATLISLCFISCNKDEVTINQPISFTIERIIITNTDIFEAMPYNYENYDFHIYLQEHDAEYMTTGSQMNSLETLDCKDATVYDENSGFVSDLVFTFNENERTFEHGFVLHTMQAYSNPSQVQAGFLDICVQTYSMTEIYRDDNAVTFEAAITDDGFAGTVFGTWNY